MSLADLKKLQRDRETSRIEVSKQRVLNDIDAIRDQIAFYREYPDLFVDDIKGPDSTFNFYFSQRVYLRSAMRHRKVYAVFPRGE